MTFFSSNSQSHITIGVRSSKRTLFLQEKVMLQSHFLLAICWSTVVLTQKKTPLMTSGLLILKQAFGKSLKISKECLNQK